MSMATVKQAAAEQNAVGRWPNTERGIRWLIFQNTDGFADRCTRKVGRRRLILMNELAAWGSGRGGGGINEKAA